MEEVLPDRRSTALNVETGDARKPAGITELREADRMLQDAERIGHPDLVARALRNRNTAHRRAMKALSVQVNPDIHAEQEKARLQQARAAKAAMQQRRAGERGRQALNKATEAEAEESNVGFAADDSSAASALRQAAVSAAAASANDTPTAGATWAAAAPHGDRAVNVPGANPLLPSLGGRAKRLTKKQIAQERTKLRNQKRNEQQKVKLAKEQREATHRMAWEARRRGLMLVRVAIVLPVRDDRVGFSIWPYGRTARVRFAYFNAKRDPATKKSVPNVLRQVTVAEVPLSEQVEECEHYERARAAKRVLMKAADDVLPPDTQPGFNEIAKAPRDKAVQCARLLLSHQVVNFIKIREQTVDEAAEALRDEHLGVLIAAVMKQHTRLFELAKKWDEDKNGEIDSGEFARAARSLGIGDGASNEQVGQVGIGDVFELLDEDKSGAIDYRELKSLLHAAMRKKAAARRQRDLQSAKRRQDTEHCSAAAAERSKSPSPQQGRQRRASIVSASPAGNRPPPDSDSTAPAICPVTDMFKMGAGSGSAMLSPWLTMDSKPVHEESHCHVGCQVSLPFAMHAPALLHSLTYVAAREEAESVRRKRTAVITPLNEYRMKAASRGTLIAARSLSHKPARLPQPANPHFHPGNLSMRACAQHLSDILTSRGIQCPSVVSASTKQELMFIARRHGVSLQFTGHQHRSSTVEQEETALPALDGRSHVALPKQLRLNLSLVDPRPEYGGEYGATCSGMRALPELGATSKAAAAATRARLTQAEFKLHTFDWTSFAGRANSRRHERIRQQRRMTAEVDAQRKRELASAAKRLQRALRRKLAGRTPEQKAAALHRQIERTAARVIQDGYRAFLRRKYGPDFGDIVLAHCLVLKEVRETVTDLLHLIIDRAVAQTRALAKERKRVQKRVNERVLADRLCAHKTPRVAWPPPRATRSRPESRGLASLASRRTPGPQVS